MYSMSKNTGINYIHNQIKCLLDSLTEDDYKRDLPILGHVSISKHLRHVYEFYKLINDARHNRVIDYSLRQRNEDFENSIAIAESYLQIMFDEISEIDFTTDLIVVNDEIDSDKILEFKSSFGRELMYAFDHAIHHLAIIKIGATSMNVVLPKSFGVAPSTLKYQNQN